MSTLTLLPLGVHHCVTRTLLLHASTRGPLASTLCHPLGVKQATRAPAALSTLAVAADAADEAADARPMLHSALMSSASLLAPVFQVPSLPQCISPAFQLQSINDDPHMCIFPLHVCTAGLEHIVLHKDVMPN